MEKRLLGYYNYTVIVTYIGMVCALLGITFAIGGNEALAVILLMISGLCDMCDGAIASTMKRTDDEKAFGIQIDSLSDLICFGVTPAMIVFCFCQKSAILLISISFYVLCALIRLAYFNVEEINRQRNSEGKRSYYFGLPVTSSALLIPLVYIVTSRIKEVRSVTLIIAMFIIGATYILPFKTTKAKATGKIFLTSIGIAELIYIIVNFGNI